MKQAAMPSYLEGEDKAINILRIDKESIFINFQSAKLLVKVRILPLQQFFTVFKCKN
jgi:hypothetical protein